MPNLAGSVCANKGENNLWLVPDSISVDTPLSVRPAPLRLGHGLLLPRIHLPCEIWSLSQASPSHSDIFNFIVRLIFYLYICCIIKNIGTGTLLNVSCLWFTRSVSYIVTILLLTNLCIFMTLGKVMICIFIISRNQLAKELFSILEVFCGILYHQFLRNACLKII